MCANGLDDDGDTLADCFDPDCAAGPACPAACGAEATFEALACRTTVLGARTDAETDDEAFLDAVRRRIDKLHAARTDAETACAAAARGAARRGLRRMAKQAGKYDKLVRSAAGRAAVPDEAVRTVLRDQAQALREAAKALRAGFVCPPA